MRQAVYNSLILFLSFTLIRGSISSLLTEGVKPSSSLEEVVGRAPIRNPTPDRHTYSESTSSETRALESAAEAPAAALSLSELLSTNEGAQLPIGSHKINLAAALLHQKANSILDDLIKKQEKGLNETSLIGFNNIRCKKLNRLPTSSTTLVADFSQDHRPGRKRLWDPKIHQNEDKEASTIHASKEKWSPKKDRIERREGRALIGRHDGRNLRTHSLLLVQMYQRPTRRGRTQVTKVAISTGIP
jgi:hypothetical protein